MMAGVITVNKRLKLAIHPHVVMATIIGVSISIDSVAQPQPPTYALSSHGALGVGSGVSEPIDSNTWRGCVEAAEAARSKRDLEFFLKAASLSNANKWFVSHSYANEQRFCVDLAACERAFNRSYDDVMNSSYSNCDQFYSER